MKQPYVMIMLFMIAFQICQAQKPKVIVGSIRTLKIDSAMEASFEGVISFGFDTVAIEYWKPGKLNRSKILYLTVKNRKDLPGSVIFVFDTFGHKELFSDGHLQYDEASGSFSFRAWNSIRTFAYTGKLL